MLIKVDLPAPFSPSKACTSPRRRSKSTWSLASTPGNSFVIPRSSRTGGSSIQPLLLPPDGLRRLDLAGDDLGLHLVDLGQPGLRNLGLCADLSQGHALVLQV